MMWKLIRTRGFSWAHNLEPTVAFRTQYSDHYLYAGEPSPPGAKTSEATTEKALRWWRTLPQQERLEWERRMGLPK